MRNTMTSNGFQNSLAFAIVKLLFILPFISAIPNAVFEGVQADDGELIKSALDKDIWLLNSVGVGGQTPLLHAVLTGKMKAVQTLLDLGADTQAVEKDGYNLLHAAGFQGRAEILALLLNSDKVHLNPLVKHADGYYPMHRACWGPQPRHTETVKVFLEHGVDPKLAAENGQICADMTRNEATKALLEEYDNGKMQNGETEEEL
jgi:ankyrin repeat protein